MPYFVNILMRKVKVGLLHECLYTAHLIRFGDIKEEVLATIIYHGGAIESGRSVVDSGPAARTMVQQLGMKFHGK